MGMLANYDLKEKLEKLAGEFLDAKKSEETAKRIRIVVEEKIADLIETEEVGQKTITLDRNVKLTVRRGLNYTADIAKINEMWINEFSSGWIAENPVPKETVVKVTLDVKGYEWYRENHPKAFLVLSEFVTVKPKKTAVTIKFAKE